MKLINANNTSVNCGPWHARICENNLVFPAFPVYNYQIILSNIDNFCWRSWKSEVYVEYFDQKGCQISQYSYNENSDTNIWEQV